MAKRPTGQTAVSSNGNPSTGPREACPYAESEENLVCRKADCQAHLVERILPASEILLLETRLSKTRLSETSDISKRGISLGLDNHFERESLRIYAGWLRTISRRKVRLPCLRGSALTGRVELWVGAAICVEAYNRKWYST